MSENEQQNNNIDKDENGDSGGSGGNGPAFATMSYARQFRKFLHDKLSLIHDSADELAIDQRLRDGVEMSGSNLWVLIFAILIASIGLNVNATAIIIGAMLISPLMGPIMGIGYGIAINDYPLVRNGFSNMGIAVLLALMTSTFYFLLTPLTDAQSELLSRTRPTLLDVMIASCGGLAGIVGATRQQKTNVIPGVAIATALMPPLCTAGYGLANAKWDFFWGASYLFLINSVFIALSVVVVIVGFQVSERKFIVDAKAKKRVHGALKAIVILTVLPSVYLSYILVGDEIFRSRVNQFIRQEFQFRNTYVAKTLVKPQEQSIGLVLVGERLSSEKISDISRRMRHYGIEDAKLDIHQAGSQTIDVSSLKASLTSDFLKSSQEAIANQEQIIAHLQQQLTKSNSASDTLRDIPAELQALYPQIREVLISNAWQWDRRDRRDRQDRPGPQPVEQSSKEAGENSGQMSTKDSISPKADVAPTQDPPIISEAMIPLLSVSVDQEIPKEDRDKINAWLKARLQVEDLRVIYTMSDDPSIGS